MEILRAKMEILKAKMEILWAKIQIRIQEDLIKVTDWEALTIREVIQEVIAQVQEDSLNQLNED